MDSRQKAWIEREATRTGEVRIEYGPVPALHAGWIPAVWLNGVPVFYDEAIGYSRERATEVAGRVGLACQDLLPANTWRRRFLPFESVDVVRPAAPWADEHDTYSERVCVAPCTDRSAAPGERCAPCKAIDDDDFDRRCRYE